MMKRIAFAAALAIAVAIPLFAEDDDIDAQMKKAMENLDKPAASKADMNKLQEQAMSQIHEAEAENKAEDAEKKAAVQKLVDQKGPASFPDWTPAVPQFNPAGPPARKMVDGEAKIIQTGTSPLSPDKIADEWDKFVNPKFSHERTGSLINNAADLFVTYRKVDDNTEVKLEVERKAGEKTTHVTISSPIRSAD
jgi:hypothetical protein